MGKEPPPVVKSILRHAEKRYISDVIRPVLSELREAKSKLKASIPKGRGADDLKAKAIKAQIEYIGEVEGRVKEHLENTKGRFTLSDRKKA